LEKINVLCGKNSTGKSTILEAAASNVTAGFGVTADENFIRELF